MTVQEFLKRDESENGNLIFGCGASGRLSDVVGELDTYSSICGGWTEGVFQWMTHNVIDIIEKKNEKFTGWIVITGGVHENKEHKLYIENSILQIDVKNDWKHAKNLFCKYLKKA